MSNLNELRVASGILGGAAVAASLLQSPVVPPLAVLPWVIALGLLVSRRGPAVDGHPNATAHLIAAQAIAKHLARLNWPSATSGAHNSPEDPGTSP